MPASYTIDHARHLVITRASGVMTDADVVAMRTQLRADPKFVSTYAQLSDLRDLAYTAISSATLDQIARTSVFLASPSRALVAHTPFQFGIARLFAGLSEGHGRPIHVFRTMTEAEAWIGVSGAADDGG